MRKRTYKELVDYSRQQFISAHAALESGSVTNAKAYLLGAIVTLNGGRLPDGGEVRDFAEIELGGEQ